MSSNVVSSIVPPLTKWEEAARLAWQEVVRHVIDVLRGHEELGFVSFHEKANPSIAEIQLAVSAMRGALDGMLRHPGVSHDAQNDLTNCLQQIHHIERLFVALSNRDESEYNICIRMLKTQRI